MWCSIRVYDRPDYDFDDPSQRVAMLSVLLHEMIHAFLLLYSCPLKCQFDPRSSGHTGHAGAWQDAAYAVEKACNDSGCLGVDIDLGRLWCLKFEMEATGMQPPGDVGRWGFDLHEVYLA